MIPSVAYQIMFDITLEDSETEDLTSPTGLPYKGMGEPNSNSPLLAAGALVRKGLGERSTEE
jgi:hypothetical protein